MLTLLTTYGIPLAGLLALLLAGKRTNAARIWREEAEAYKARVDRAIDELEEIKGQNTRLQEQFRKLEEYNQTLVILLSTIDPQKLDELRNSRGL